MTNTEKIQVCDKALELIDNMLDRYFKKYRTVFVCARYGTEIGRWKTASEAAAAMDMKTKRIYNQVDTGLVYDDGYEFYKLISRK